MMAQDFDRILDECIDRINRGDNLADCLSDYPAYSDRLKPLLQSMHDVQKTYTFVPLADTKRAARQKFQTALGKPREMTPLLSFFKAVSQPAVWARVAVLILAIAGTVVIWAVLTPPGLVPSADGNFAFRISDEPSAINAFDSLNLTISEVRLRPVGSDRLLEFTPQIGITDLTQLQGERFQEIWRGHVPAGQYSHLHIYVSEVRGTLESTRQTIDMNVPGGVVHMPLPFEITVDRVTIYTFEITVVATDSIGEYILKLEIDESGARQESESLV